MRISDWSSDVCSSDLGLDGDVERRDRFVGDDDLWVERQGASHAHALALAARELIRVAVEGGLVQPNQFEQFVGALVGIALAGAVGDRAVADNAPDGVARVKRGERSLENQDRKSTRLNSSH